MPAGRKPRLGGKEVLSCLTVSVSSTMGGVTTLPRREEVRDGVEDVRVARDATEEARVSRPRVD